MISNLCNFGRTWLACKKKYKVLFMKVKNNKHSNEILEYDRRECWYYEHMDVWNGQHANVVNQISTNTQEDDDQQRVL